jgi:hypothetical protein
VVIESSRRFDRSIEVIGSLEDADQVTKALELLRSNRRIVHGTHH